MDRLTSRFGEAAVRRAIFLGMAAALLVSMVTVSTITAQNLGTGSIDLGNATFATDADTDITATGVVVNTAAVVADTSEEATIAPYGALNNALVAGDYAYKFDVFESGVNTWLASQTYTIEVWETTGGVTSSLGSYGTLQGVADAGTVEGATVTLNLGSVVPDEFDIVVTKN